MTVSCFDLLDRHVVGGHADDLALSVGGHADDLALSVGGHADQEAPRSGATGWTYARLLEDVAAFAGVLRYCGVVPGDQVAVTLPETPELVVTLLACARIGAEHAVGSTGGDKVLVTSSTETEALRGATAAAVLVKSRPGSAYEPREGRDHDWDVVMRAGRTDPASWVEGAVVVPWDEPTRALLGPLLDGGTVRLDA